MGGFSSGARHDRGQGGGPRRGAGIKAEEKGGRGRDLRVAEGQASKPLRIGERGAGIKAVEKGRGRDQRVAEGLASKPMRKGGQAGRSHSARASASKPPRVHRRAKPRQRGSHPATPHGVISHLK